MSADLGYEFVDTNILVYALDASAGSKQEAARRLLTRLWKDGTGCLSLQVLQEFFMAVTRKVAQPLTVDVAAERVRELTAWKIFSPTAEDVLLAIALHQAARLNFWDSLVIHSAAQLGCELLWTEDMNHGQVVSGVRIQNPFPP